MDPSQLIDAEEYLHFMARSLAAEDTVAQVTFVERALAMAPPMRVLDLGCGHGRHAHELARRGYRVLGVDLVDGFLAIARREAEDAGLAVDYERRDMAELDHVAAFDRSMPELTAGEAMTLRAELAADVPFIIVSGSIGEEVAVDALRAGADDIVLKSRLARLPPAVERELRDRDSRRAARAAAQALLESEERYRMSEARFARLVDSGIIGITLADVNGRIHDANDAWLTMVGYSRAELQAGTIDWAAMTPPEYREVDAAAVRQLAVDGVAPPWEKEMIRKDGTRVAVLVGVAMLNSVECVAFVADLTERKRALSIILTYAGMARYELAEGDPLRQDLEEVERAAERAAALTRQLLAFSRRQVLRPIRLDVNDVLGEMERMLRRLIGEDVELRLDLEPDLVAVMFDPGQLEQVVMNLAVNARDAMPRGGTLTIVTSLRTLDEAFAAQHMGVNPGRHVLLEITDTGVGMDAATRARAFEPFFTTKEIGKGTGLGLPTVLGIVQQSGGTIWLHSEPGRGTRFEIYLPVVGAGAEQPHEPAPDGEPARGSETILLVEDDVQLRTVTRLVLTRHGYNVLDAESAGDAIILCEQTTEPIHLLLTDVVMPRMGGRQLAERLQQLRPGLPVLYMSGYTEDAVLRHGVREAEVAFMQKPITPQTLRERVRQMLDARPRTGQVPSLPRP